MKRTFLTLVLLFLTVIPGSAYAAPGDLQGKVICLDPGHGGSDPGAVYNDGSIYLEEADINLDVAYGLKALLEGDDAVVVMTRYGDDYRSNSDRYTFCNAQDTDILVSVHTNSTTNSASDGALGLYFQSDDRVLAQAIYDVMYPYLRDRAPAPANFTGFGLSRYASGVILKSDMPAMIAEPLFMSNAAEAAWLATPIYLDSGLMPNPDCVSCRRAQIAQAIHGGVLSYFGVGGDAPPSVTITSPSDGASVAGTVLVIAAASDDQTVTQVAFFVDGASIGVDAEGMDGWSASWDTTGYADGTHMVVAVATDSAGQTTQHSISVTVLNSGGGGITLTATAYKVKGLRMVDLAWSGADGEQVTVYRDGTQIEVTANDGSYTDHIGGRGSGTFSYKVCETDGLTCSKTVTVTF
jgi:N-acetylmuramoyl-L-alanine amidase